MAVIHPLDSPFRWKEGPMPLNDEDVFQLCRVGLFQGIRAADMMHLVRSSHVVVAPAGAIVIAQNSVADYFYVVADGFLRVRINDRGKDVVVGCLTRGQYFGESAIMEGTRRTATVEAARDTRLIRVPAFT